MKNELEKFYRLADDIEIPMMTTRRSDGHLRSRAMANQKRADGAEPWPVVLYELVKGWFAGDEPTWARCTS